MSTRSTTHFVDEWNGEQVIGAIIYRHSDGYPAVAGADIFRFFTDVSAQTRDTRFSDSSYLAAKYVVWLADLFRGDGDDPMDFRSVGIVGEDPDDIEYRYVVNCGRKHSKSFPDWPEVTCVNVSTGSVAKYLPPKVAA